MPNFKNAFFGWKGFPKNVAHGRSNAYKFRTKYSRKTILEKMIFGFWEGWGNVSTAPPHYFGYFFENKSVQILILIVQIPY